MTEPAFQATLTGGHARIHVRGYASPPAVTVAIVDPAARDGLAADLTPTQAMALADAILDAAEAATAGP